MTQKLTHVAVIMDGNRRWAKDQGKPSIEGHERGAQSLRTMVEESIRQGIAYLTVYGFSSENWGRSHEEVDGLFALMERLLTEESQALHEQGVRLKIIGDRNVLPEGLLDLIERVETKTKGNKALQLTIALSYGARQEMIRATKKAFEALSKGEMTLEDLNEESFASFLDTKDMPDPDLLIRPGGEKRLSNFLLWQLSYAELYFSKTYWPEFGVQDYREAIETYAERQRRFGVENNL